MYEKNLLDDLNEFWNLDILIFNSLQRMKGIVGAPPKINRYLLPRPHA